MAKPSDVVRSVAQQQTFRFVPKLNPDINSVARQETTAVDGRFRQVAELAGIGQQITSGALRLQGIRKQQQAVLEQQEAAVAGVKFKQRMNQLFREASQSIGTENDLLENGDIDNLFQEIQQEFVQGKSKAFLNSFLPQASVEEAKFMTKLEDLSIAKFKTTQSNNTRIIVRDRLEDLLAQTSGISPEDFGRLAEDPENLALFNQEITQGRQSISSELRTLLDDAIEENELAGLDPLETSEVFLEVVSSLAEKHGVPELLDFTREQSRKGPSLQDTELLGAIDRSIGRSVGSQNRLQAEAIRSMKLQEEAQANNLEIGLQNGFDLIQSGKISTQDRHDILTNLENQVNEFQESNHFVDINRINELRDTISVLRTGSRTESDAGVLDALQRGIALGTVKRADIISMGEFLNTEDLGKLIKSTDTSTLSSPQKSNRNKLKTTSKIFNKLAQPGGPLGDFIQGGPEAKSRAILDLTSRLEQWETENEGVIPDSEILKWASEINKREQGNLTFGAPQLGAGLGVSSPLPEESNDLDSKLEQLLKVREAFGAPDTE